MTILEKAVDHFFDDYGDIYNGPNDLQVVMLDGNGVLVAAPWPGENLDGEHQLGFSVESNNYRDFIGKFRIQNDVPETIKRISVQDLIRLYLNGRGWVNCGIGDDGLILWFQRTQDGRMQVTDVYDTEHELHYQLQQPEEFISYTQQYYKVDRYTKEFLQLPGLKLKGDGFVNIN